MFCATLAKEHFSIAEEDARINNFLAFRANGFSQLPKNFLAVFFDNGRYQSILRLGEGSESTTKLVLKQDIKFCSGVTNLDLPA